MRDNAIFLVSFYVYFSQTIAHNTRRHVKPTLRLFSFGGAILIITPHDIHCRQFPLWLCTRSSRSIGIRYDYPAASSLFMWCVKIEKVLLRSFAVVTKKLFFISLERDSEVSHFIGKSIFSILLVLLSSKANQLQREVNLFIPFGGRRVFPPPYSPLTIVGVEKIMTTTDVIKDIEKITQNRLRMDKVRTELFFLWLVCRTFSIN